ncbi:MAG: hypothetical protein Greene101449_199 [Candidatus Peregrinibacteria bacterium Greene1014_49]|nr:MAG: hypothetical protein Greene101449_199 [Candidatus Peregrinibacteria bacterium Greene1014_49]
MLRRFLTHGLILGYLAITASALLFTFTKVVFPFPSIFIRWSYGMIAPYQRDVPWNFDVSYEGQLPDGEWQPINIHPYMPYQFAEQKVREFLLPYLHQGELTRRQKFTELALQILDHERARGIPYTAVRVFYEQWDRSPGGHEFLHLPAFTHRALLTQVQ